MAFYVYFHDEEQIIEWTVELQILKGLHIWLGTIIPFAADHMCWQIQRIKFIAKVKWQKLISESIRN